MSDLNLAQTKKKLRSEIRARRNELSASYREQASLKVIQQFRELSLSKNTGMITGFFSQDGELDIEPLMNSLAKDGCKLAIPVIDFSNNVMQFQLIDSNSQFDFNRFGIKEPVWNRALQLEPNSIDIVLYPLVAFDRGCRRLGMGGGYYDKYFSHLNPMTDDRLRTTKTKNHHAPLLIGCAYDCQRVEYIPIEPWDIELDYVVTESSIYSRN
jgi:5-formyltetrahydrofolate cyclo-ligase